MLSWRKQINHRGVPYVFGGTTPSGFKIALVKYVFAKQGISFATFSR